MLVEKCEVREERGVVREGRKLDPMPALAIITSILWTFSAASLTRRSVKVSGNGDEKSRMVMRSLPVLCTGSESRSEVEAVRERMVAITVVFGRDRRMVVMARPIPVYK